MIDINLKPLFEFTKNVRSNMNRLQYTKRDLDDIHNNIKLMEVEANVLKLSFQILMLDLAKQGTPIASFANQRTPINTKP